MISTTCRFAVLMASSLAFTTVFTSAMAPPPASSAGQSGCVNFYMTQDGCASPNPSSNCRPKVTSGAIQQFMSGGTPQSPYSPFGSQPKQLAASSTPTNSTGTPVIASRVASPAANTPSLATSTGLCGSYDSATDMGVCLWSGPEASVAPKTGQKDGWLGVGLIENCRKEVIFQRTGSTSAPMTAIVADGCNFGTTQASFGCSQIFLSKKAFMAMNPSPEEMANGFLKDSITWDFASKANATNIPV